MRPRFPSIQGVFAVVTVAATVFATACDSDDGPRPRVLPEAHCKRGSGEACASGGTQPPPTQLASESSMTGPVTDCNAHAATVCAAYAECAPYYLARTTGTQARCESHLAAACRDLEAAGTPIDAGL